MEDIRVILPIDSTKKAVILAQQLRVAVSRTSRDRTRTTANTSGSQMEQTESNKHQNPCRDSVTSNNSTRPSNIGEWRSGNCEVAESKRRSENFVLTIGKGYRCLIQRFLDNYRDDAAVMDARNKDHYALLWRTEDWMS